VARRRHGDPFDWSPDAAIPDAALSEAAALPATPAGAAAPSLRVTLISIAGFWALYFVILTIRALAIYNMHSGTGSRALVSVASMGVTFLFYLLLRRIAIERLALAIAVAAVLAAPAALLYSTINYACFYIILPEEKRHDHPRKLVTIFEPGVRAPDRVTRVTDGDSSGRKTTIIESSGGHQKVTQITVGTAEDEDDDSKMSPWKEIADQAANGYFFFASWAALYLALCYAEYAGRLARHAARLEAAAQAAELRALRYQVNPHFLFNTLNSLSSLVMTGQQAEAERMIINLAAFFRTSLTGDPTEDVLLSEEIALQRLYLDIEAIRFPDRLHFVVDVPARLERACVPGLILQPLIENAIKHGVARARRPVTVRILADEQDGRLRLRVEDDGDGALGRALDGTGVGLANVRDRLRARYGAEALSEWRPRDGGGFLVTLTMPLQIDGC
jgi:two-component system LytT family sensor kinase